VAKSRLLANVNGVGNAILVQGDFVGSTLYSGPGAGAEATASAVVADLIDLARQVVAGATVPVYPALGYRDASNDSPVLAIEEIDAEYYLRIPVIDRVGVMAKISNVLQDQEISIEAIIQKEAASNESVPIVILTHRVKEAKLNKAMAALENLEEITGAIMRIRVEPFHGEAT